MAKQAAEIRFALKGHGFSRANRELNQSSALAAEGMQLIENKIPSGAKAKNSF